MKLIAIAARYHVELLTRLFTAALAGLFFLSAPLRAAPTACLGPIDAKGFIVYLHGLEKPGTMSPEESQNRDILQKLAQELSLRIALPRAPLCPMGELCWSGKNTEDILQTYRSFRTQAQTCWTGDPKWSVIGFSNGGYFALKLYKVHRDAQLQRLIASGSAGTWDPPQDRPNPFSSFHLVIGNRDITRKKAHALAGTLRGALPRFTFASFAGGHRLDYGALVSILREQVEPDLKK